METHGAVSLMPLRFSKDPRQGKGEPGSLKSKCNSTSQIRAKTVSSTKFSSNRPIALRKGVRSYYPGRSLNWQEVNDCAKIT
jgi:hypothetical protein